MDQELVMMEERRKAEQREDQEDEEQIQVERCGQDEELVSDEPEQPPPPPPQPAQPSPYAEAVERKEQWQGLEAPEEPRAAAEAASPSAAAPAAAAPPPPPPPANVAIAIVAGTVAAAAATCDLREREEIGKTESPSGKTVRGWSFWQTADDSTQTAEPEGRQTGDREEKREDVKGGLWKSSSHWLGKRPRASPQALFTARAP